MVQLPTILRLVFLCIISQKSKNLRTETFQDLLFSAGKRGGEFLGSQSTGRDTAGT